jgi:two-component system alkaline phosphatase synthesis response regulator PhoP
MPQKLVYVVEDESDIAELIRFNLQMEGFQVETYPSGELGYKAVELKKPDLLILDIMLPGMNGLDICRYLKSKSDTQKLPIILVSAKGEETDIVKGLELGADDYVTKPFSPKILSARVHAILRRSRAMEPEDKDLVMIGDLTINIGRFEASFKGEKIDLTQSEFRILHFLAQRPGWVFTRTQIVEAIRGENYVVTDRTIDFQMVGLRRKLGGAGGMIETVRGVGYRFTDQPT